MNELTPLLCIAPDGQQNTFFWRVQPGFREQRPYWHFSVKRTDPADPKDKFFELTLTQLDENTVFVTLIENHHAPWTVKKGVSEAIFAAARKYLQKDIVSSRKYVAGAGEHRTEHADRMWDRFRDAGLATLDSETGRYRYICC